MPNPERWLALLDCSIFPLGSLFGFTQSPRSARSRDMLNPEIWLALLLCSSILTGSLKHFAQSSPAARSGSLLNLSVWLARQLCPNLSGNLAHSFLMPDLRDWFAPEVCSIYFSGSFVGFAQSAALASSDSSGTCGASMRSV